MDPLSNSPTSWPLPLMTSHISNQMDLQNPRDSDSSFSNSPSPSFNSRYVVFHRDCHQDLIMDQESFSWSESEEEGERKCRLKSLFVFDDPLSDMRSMSNIPSMASSVDGIPTPPDSIRTTTYSTPSGETNCDPVADARPGSWLWIETQHSGRAPSFDSTRPAHFASVRERGHFENLLFLHSENKEGGKRNQSEMKTEPQGLGDADTNRLGHGTLDKRSHAEIERNESRSRPRDRSPRPNATVSAKKRKRSNEVFKCSQCSFTTKYRQNVARHCKIHSGISRLGGHSMKCSLFLLMWPKG